MKKKTLCLSVALLLIGSNAFAADGNLIVNGNVGIATTIGSNVQFEVAVPVGGAQVDSIPDMTSNTTPSGTAYTNYGYAGSAAWSAMDDNPATGWYTYPSHNDQTLYYDWGTNKTITKYTLLCAATEAPKNWTFDAWNGSQWITLDTKTNITSWSPGVKKEFSIANTGAYARYRIHVTDNNGGGNGVLVYEIEMMEDALYQTGFKVMTSGNIGIRTASPDNILTVVQYSASDPIADSWTVHACDRTGKNVIRTLPDRSGALDQLLEVELYEWKRKPLVSDDEINGLSGRVMNADELERKRQELSAEKSSLPKFQAKRLGVMLDDPNIPEEIISVDGSGKKGIDLIGYIGWLHATIKELALRVQELERR